jgi:hypothetical protein
LDSTHKLLKLSDADDEQQQKSGRSSVGAGWTGAALREPARMRFNGDAIAFGFSGGGARAPVAAPVPVVPLTPVQAGCLLAQGAKFACAVTRGEP